MRIQPKRSNKKLLVLSILCVLIVGGISAYLVSVYMDRDTKSSDTPKIEGSKSDKKDPNDDAADTPQAPQDTQTKVEDKTPIQYEGEQLNDEEPISDERFRIPEGQ